MPVITTSNKYIPVPVYGLDSELKFPGGQAKEQFLFPNCIAHAPERPPTFSIEIDESPTTVLWWGYGAGAFVQKKSVNLNCEVPLW